MLASAKFLGPALSWHCFMLELVVSGYHAYKDIAKLKVRAKNLVESALATRTDFACPQSIFCVYKYTHENTKISSYTGHVEPILWSEPHTQSVAVAAYFIHSACVALNSFAVLGC